MKLSEMTFTAIPGQNDPESLAIGYRKNLLKSYEVYLTKLQQSLKLDLEFFLQKIYSLDVKEKFSPAFFVYYDLLKEGYRQKNLHHIFDALQGLKNIEEERYYVKDLKYTTVLTQDWESVYVRDLRQTPSDDQVVMKPIQMLSLVHWHAKHFPPDDLRNAVQMMHALDEGLKNEFFAYLSYIKLYAGKVLESASSARFFGVIYLRLPFPEENAHLLYLRNTVHELSHLHLYAMMAEDPIVLNPETELFSSPLRPDRRPMIGIFHATFVLARMVRILRKFLQQNPQDEEALAMVQHNENCLLEGLKVISTSARLSEKGRAIFNSIEECAFV